VLPTVEGAAFKVAPFPSCPLSAKRSLSANTQPGNPRLGLAAALLLPEQHTRDCATCSLTLPICCSSMQYFHSSTIPISPGPRPPRTLPVAITTRSRYRRPVQPRLPRQSTLHSLKCLSPVPFFAYTNTTNTTQIRRQHHIPSITPCILDSTKNNHPPTRALRSLIVSSAAALHTTPCTHIPRYPHIGGFE
jgi:hypothetical protein